MESFEKLVSSLRAFVWEWGIPMGDDSIPIVILALIGVGGFLTLRLGFIQIRCFGHGLAVATGRYDDPNDPGDAFSEFVGPPEEPVGFVGWFLMCCGGMLCIPVLFAGGIIGWARNATDMNGGYGQNGRGPFGGFGYNDDRGGRRNGRAVRRTGGSSRSGGGGRSGSGSRGSGGSRSGGGGRRR